MAMIGVVVVPYKAVKRIEETLETLQKSLEGFEPGEVEVVVWDNETGDGGADLVEKKFPQFKLVRSVENTGFAGGNNRGLKELNPSQYLVLVNDDTISDPAWIKEAIKVAESDPKIMVVQAFLRLHPATDLINSWGNDIQYLGYGYAAGYKVPVVQAGDKLADAREIGYASGAAMVVKMELLRQTFLFDERFFMYHEDLDLGWRARLLGYKTVMAPKSVVYHKYEFRKSLKKLYFMERNRFLVSLQNYHWMTLLLLFPAALLLEIGTFFYSIFGGWAKEKLKVYWYFLHLSTWGQIWHFRKQIQSQRRAKDREVTKVFKGTIDFQEMRNPLLVYIVNPLTSAYWQLVRLVMFW